MGLGPRAWGGAWAPGLTTKNAPMAGPARGFFFHSLGENGPEAPPPIQSFSATEVGLLNAGEDHRACCRQDGDRWRRHCVPGR